MLQLATQKICLDRHTPPSKTSKVGIESVANREEALMGQVRVDLVPNPFVPAIDNQDS